MPLKLVSECCILSKGRGGGQQNCRHFALLGSSKSLNARARIMLEVYIMHKVLLSALCNQEHYSIAI